ncbi:MAG: hypothetical protein ABT22_07520 [Thiobacillus sp. SCN 64-317]|nr:PEP-CTERM sorting domain-containing protein [Thiobacillus sp.]ODV12130.1 MAG: hypothetical protein ABT22_07520 [Thiobacillus sp. SCN 64-317]
MIKATIKTLSIAPIFLAVMSFSQTAVATPLLTPVNAGNEVSLATILNTISTADGITLARVDDANDAFWTLAGNSTVLARARFAGYDNLFGVIPGTTGGVTDFQPLISSLSGDGIVGNGGPETSFPLLAGDFRLAIRTPTGQIWSSLALDNSDLMDHMVTWVDVHDPLHYFVAFEDLSFTGGSDGDYNDVVLELRHIKDGPLSVPEPGSLVLTALGLVALAHTRRVKA